MTQIQQQRLIGALLLVCILSVIAFYLISNAKQGGVVTSPEVAVEADSFVSSIDALPVSDGDVEVLSSEFETLVDPHQLAKQPLQAKEEVSDVADSLIIEKTVTPSAESKQKTSKSTTTWFLQLASFSSEKNAQAFQNKVSDLAYTAKIHPSTNDKGIIYRVRIGPESNKTELEKASKILNNKLKIKSQIIQNSP